MGEASGHRKEVVAQIRKQVRQKEMIMGLFDLFRKKGWEGEIDTVREKQWSDHLAFTRYLKKERDGD